MTDVLETAERFYALLDANEIELVIGMCSDDIEVHYPASGVLPYGGTWRGQDGLVKFLDTHDEAEEILDFEIGSMCAGTETVLALGHYKGRAKATGREWTTPFVHALTIGDGRIRRWEAFFDSAAAVAAR
jgi:ketosteroid isomerase-like protein